MTAVQLECTTENLSRTDHYITERFCQRCRTVHQMVAQLQSRLCTGPVVGNKERHVEVRQSFDLESCIMDHLVIKDGSTGAFALRGISIPLRRSKTTNNAWVYRTISTASQNRIVLLFPQFSIWHATQWLRMVYNIGWRNFRMEYCLKRSVSIGKHRFTSWTKIQIQNPVGQSNVCRNAVRIIIVCVIVHYIFELSSLNFGNTSTLQ